MRFSALFIAVSLVPSSAVACKYTVRDVTFVTGGEPRYKLFILADEMPSEQVAALQRAADEALADTNVESRMIAMGSGGEVPADAERALAALEIDRGPAMALMSADGRGLKIDLTDDALRGDALKTRCGQLFESPAQTQLKDLLLRGHHSVIVVFPGTDDEANRSVQTQIQAAIDEVEASLPLLPKPMDLPPASITISPDDAEQEAVLLWGLGIDPAKQVAAPRVAIVLGRCRLLGPAMILPDEHESFRRRLGIVGQDCECELDRSVMQGTMVPHSWSLHDESTAATMLGFDPGNPLVQAEVHRILARGPRGGSGELPSLPSEDLALGGLQIIDIDELVASAAADSDRGVDGEATTADGSANPATEPPVTEASADGTTDSVAASDPSTGASTTAAANQGGSAVAPASGDGESETAPPPATTMAVTSILAGLAVVGLIGITLVMVRARG